MTCLHVSLNTTHCGADPTHIPMTWSEAECDCEHCLAKLAARKQADADAWAQHLADKQAGEEAQAAFEAMREARAQRVRERHGIVPVDTAPKT